VLKGANQTADLLAHEQGHYNIGILVGRAMARELEQLSSANPHTLAAAATKVFDLHRLTRMPVVQDDYDTTTQHSQNTTEQAHWNGWIAAGLAAAVCDKLNQNDL
jgi:predicted secreted Zn-dependent protease